MHMPKRAAKPSQLTDVFFRHMVGNMRNGVLAIARDGAVVLVNDEACRLFDLPPGASLVGMPYGEVLHGHPDIVRVLGGAFDMVTLPNRAELRLRSTSSPWLKGDRHDRFPVLLSRHGHGSSQGSRPDTGTVDCRE